MASAYGYNLDCSFTQTNWGTPVGNGYGAYCYFSFDDNDYVNLVQVTGDHTGHELSEVKYLSVYGSGSTSTGATTLPSNLKTLFPDLVFLQWASAGLKDLTASDFSSWTNLVQVNFMGNYLRSLDADLFTNCPKLQNMDFSMNPIDVIGNGFFMGLNHLTQVSFMSVKCIGMSYMGSQGSVAAQISDIQHLCGPLTPLNDAGECAADCSSLFAGIDLTATEVEKKTLGASVVLKTNLFN